MVKFRHYRSLFRQWWRLLIWLFAIFFFFFSFVQVVNKSVDNIQSSTDVGSNETKVENVTIGNSTKKLNFLVILADDLGWGDVSWHGSSQIPTPNLDLLASTGIVLNNFYVSPLCSPSRSALLTGYHPIHTGMHIDVIGATQPYGLPLRYRTMGNHFQSLGYRTHMVGKWHQGFYKKEFMPTERGFDTFLGFLTGHTDYFNRTGGEGWDDYGYDYRENLERANLTHNYMHYATYVYTDRVIDLITDHSKTEEPFLIYFAQQSVHTGNWFQGSIQPPLKYRKKYKHIKDQPRKLFAGMLNALDDSVELIFDALNRTGLLSNTVIVFSTDNGGSHGGLGGRHIDRSAGSNWPLKGGKYTLWEGGVRATAFLWYQSLVKTVGPYVSNHLMHLTDILPTLYSAAGGVVSDLGDIDGIDMWSTLSLKATHSPRTNLLHNIDHINRFWAVRDGNYKLTTGTALRGIFDIWYVAPGQLNESISICYNCTRTSKILNSLGIQYKILNLTVDCKLGPEKRLISCDGMNHSVLCLFDLNEDPCEMVNIADQRPDIVKQLYSLYIHYNQSYVKQENRPPDPKANPKNWGHFWGPWQ